MVQAEALVAARPETTRTSRAVRRHGLRTAQTARSQPRRDAAARPAGAAQSAAGRACSPSSTALAEAFRSGLAGRKGCRRPALDRRASLLVTDPEADPHRARSAASATPLSTPSHPTRRCRDRATSKPTRRVIVVRDHGTGSADELSTRSSFRSSPNTQDAPDSGSPSPPSSPMPSAVTSRSKASREWARALVWCSPSPNPPAPALMMLRRADDAAHALVHTPRSWCREHDGDRLDVFLAAATSLTRRAARTLIASGDVLRNGVR